VTLSGPAVTPVELDITNVRHALEQQGIAPEVVVLPPANHVLLEVDRGELRELAGATGFPPALQSAILEWLRPRIALAPPTR